MKNRSSFIKFIKNQVKIPEERGCSCIYTYTFYSNIKYIKIDIVKFCEKKYCHRTLASGEINYHTFHQMRKVFTY